MGRFSKINAKIAHKISSLATSGRHNSAITTDHRKLVTNLTLYGMSSFHFTVRINSVSFSWAVHSVQETFTKFSATSDARSRVTRHAVDGLSGRGLMTS